jgi:hypothetical protein
LCFEMFRSLVVWTADCPPGNINRERSFHRVLWHERRWRSDARPRLPPALLPSGGRFGGSRQRLFAGMSNLSTRKAVVAAPHRDASLPALLSRLRQLGTQAAGTLTAEHVENELERIAAAKLSKAKAGRAKKNLRDRIIYALKEMDDDGGDPLGLPPLVQQAVCAASTSSAASAASAASASAASTAFTASTASTASAWLLSVELPVVEQPVVAHPAVAQPGVVQSAEVHPESAQPVVEQGLTSQRAAALQAAEERAAELGLEVGDLLPHAAYGRLGYRRPGWEVPHTLNTLRQELRWKGRGMTEHDRCLLRSIEAKLPAWMRTVPTGVVQPVVVAQSSMAQPSVAQPGVAQPAEVKTVCWSDMTVQVIERSQCCELFCAYHRCFHPRHEFTSAQKLSAWKRRYCNAFADADARADATPGEMLDDEQEVYRMAKYMCVHVVHDASVARPHRLRITWDGRVTDKAEQRMNSIGYE